MDKDEKYLKSMKDKGFIKSCVWIPKKCAKQLQAYAEALRSTKAKK